MPSKYDTTPLDPDFPEKAKAAAANGERTQTLPYSGLGTQQFPPTVQAEEQTRRFAGVNTAPYATPFTGQYVPAHLPAGGHAVGDRKRKIAKIGVPEHIAIAAPYFPFWLGPIAGLLELLFVPRHETKVRFHAAQGLAAHLGIFLVTAILGVVGEITDLANIGSGIFSAVATVMLIVFTVKAWKGKPIHIPSVDSLTNWLEEKIYITPKN